MQGLLGHRVGAALWKSTLGPDNLSSVRYHQTRAFFAPGGDMTLHDLGGSLNHLTLAVIELCGPQFSIDVTNNISQGAA